MVRQDVAGKAREQTLPALSRDSFQSPLIETWAVQCSSKLRDYWTQRKRPHCVGNIMATLHGFACAPRCVVGGRDLTPRLRDAEVSVEPPAAAIANGRLTATLPNAQSGFDSRRRSPQLTGSLALL